MATPLPAQRALTAPPMPREYVLYLQAKLLEAEAGLAAMNEKYDRIKARFDRSYARRGITPETDIVGYMDAKAMNPELRYWYSKVEHYQREVAAYGATLTGLDAARRMLGSDGFRHTEKTRSRDNRRSLYRAS